MSEWIEWKGGKCPVSPDTMVDVQDRDGEKWFSTRADFHDWKHDRLWPDIDVMAYRLSKANGDKDE